MKHEVLLTREQIENALLTTTSMGSAALSLSVDKRAFKKEAMKYNLYIVNTKRLGLKYELQDILDGKHPQYPTSKLSKRLVKEGLKEYKCEECKITEYNNKPISLELNHIDGNSCNHSLDNLELLCPNCHSQTNTYRSKKLLLKNI